MLTFQDQMGREIQLERHPVRVVSTVPSITEYLIDLGVNVVGRTKFCVHPHEKIPSIPAIGGTKNFQFEKIARLQPDLIVGNKEENYAEGIERLEESFPVWMSDIVTIQDARAMMLLLAEVLRKDAVPWVSRFDEKLKSVKGTCAGKVLYLIWKDPWMTAGQKTFINSILVHLGYHNVIARDRYPKLSDEELKEIQPDHVLLSSEPYPFKQKHLPDVRRMFKTAQVKLVNGEAYSWYGTRMVKL